MIEAVLKSQAFRNQIYPRRLNFLLNQLKLTQIEIRNDYGVKGLPYVGDNVSFTISINYLMMRGFEKHFRIENSDIKT